ncbi:MAG: fructose-6-phosphate aldolase [Candidatus Caenarcaniphilales bacterium]|nr:fructose-6-phosphate aldolase [Candidatus Caenarcaniphilales bacterium]
MKFYIDSAIISEIREVASWGILSGVTTNPSLIAKAGQNFRETIVEICEIVKAPVSAEVTTETAAEMIEQGLEFASWHEQVVIKLPTCVEGLKACSALSDKGIATNLTLCFSINQALLCARAGATYVSPFIGRLEDINQDGISLLHDIRQAFMDHGLETEIISASIRTPQHVTLSALAGAQIATIPYRIFGQLIQHPLTDRGIAQFMEDWHKVSPDHRVG